MAHGRACEHLHTAAPKWVLSLISTELPPGLRGGSSPACPQPAHRRHGVGPQRVQRKGHPARQPRAAQWWQAMQTAQWWQAAQAARWWHHASWPGAQRRHHAGRRAAAAGCGRGLGHLPALLGLAGLDSCRRRLALAAARAGRNVAQRASRRPVPLASLRESGNAKLGGVLRGRVWEYRGQRSSIAPSSKERATAPCTTCPAARPSPGSRSAAA